MNKMIINNGCVSLESTDELIEVTLSDKVNIYDIIKLNIKVLKSTTIDIEYKGNETKLDVKIEVLKDAYVVINEIKEEKNIKVQNKYYLEEKAKVELNKFYDSFKVKELDIIFLNGEDASIDYNFKTISKDDQKYDIVVYHNHQRTKCNINNKGITIKKGSLLINVTSLVYNGIKGCITNQNNRIINMNDSVCKINPNLLIEENDVTANHSAYIGKFKEDILFYFMSRGINKEKAINLLIKAFLNDDSKKITKIINKYWR